MTHFGIEEVLMKEFKKELREKELMEYIPMRAVGYCLMDPQTTMLMRYIFPDKTENENDHLTDEIVEPRAADLDCWTTNDMKLEKNDKNKEILTNSMNSRESNRSAALTKKLV